MNLHNFENWLSRVENTLILVSFGLSMSSFGQIFSFLQIHHSWNSVTKLTLSKMHSWLIFPLWIRWIHKKIGTKICIVHGVRSQHTSRKKDDFGYSDLSCLFYKVLHRRVDLVLIHLDWKGKITGWRNLYEKK